MAHFSLTINKILYQFEADPWMPLLWVLHEKLNLTSTNFGCGLCGACPVHLAGQAPGEQVTFLFPALYRRFVTPFFG